MEGVVIHRLAVFLVGLLGHGDEAPLVRLNDTEAVDGKCAGDGNAGIGFGFVVAVHHTVDPRLDLGRRELPAAFSSALLPYSFSPSCYID
jgi:hypothetical protein